MFSLLLFGLDSSRLFVLPFPVSYRGKGTAKSFCRARVGCVNRKVFCQRGKSSKCLMNYFPGNSLSVDGLSSGISLSIDELSSENSLSVDGLFLPVRENFSKSPGGSSGL